MRYTLIQHKKLIKRLNVILLFVSFCVHCHVYESVLDKITFRNNGKFDNVNINSEVTLLATFIF